MPDEPNKKGPGRPWYYAERWVDVKDAYEKSVKKNWKDFRKSVDDAGKNPSWSVRVLLNKEAHRLLGEIDNKHSRREDHP